MMTLFERFISMGETIWVLSACILVLAIVAGWQQYLLSRLKKRITDVELELCDTRKRREETIVKWEESVDSLSHAHQLHSEFASGMAQQIDELKERLEKLGRSVLDMAKRSR